VGLTDGVGRGIAGGVVGYRRLAAPAAALAGREVAEPILRGAEWTGEVRREA
jgi:hypothetical protein